MPGEQPVPGGGREMWNDISLLKLDTPVIAILDELRELPPAMQVCPKATEAGSHLWGADLSNTQHLKSLRNTSFLC